MYISGEHVDVESSRECSVGCMCVCVCVWCVVLFCPVSSGTRVTNGYKRLRTVTVLIRIRDALARCGRTSIAELYTIALCQL